jgi:nucleotide-binding universal stress UspA family protein
MADTPRIVVGVDGSEDSKLALRWAVEYARAFGAQVEAVAAPEIHLTAALTEAPTGEDYLRDASARLDAAVAEVLADEGEVTVTRTVVGDRAARALVQAARGAEMLVIGSSGQGELPGMHIGSTTNYCVHHSPCPVMVLRTQVL